MRTILCFLIFIASDTAATTVITNAAAHWLTPGEIAVEKHSQANKLLLVAGRFDADHPFDHNNNRGYTLRPSDQTVATNKRPPHLAKFALYGIDLAKSHVKVLQKGPLTLVQLDAQGKPLVYSQVQNAKVLDALYTQGTDDADEQVLGAKLTENGARFSLWAPTALQVALKTYNSDKTPLNHYAMHQDPHSGVWSVGVTPAKQGLYYRYAITLYHYQSGKFEQLEVTDPYSLSLSTNSEYSQLVDLTSPQSMPLGWRQQTRPALDRPEQQIIYETHMRDFSALETRLSDASNKGKYGAFSERDSNAIRHLKALKQAGLNSVQLLPVFDIGTINEDPAQRLSLTDSLSKACRLVKHLKACEHNDHSLSLLQLLQRYSPDSDNAQALIEAIRNYDNYNWGYDPFHYTVPEGSYAKNPEGIARIVEFRQMVQALHNLGFRVIMDVVYNHTHAAGLNSTAVLDKIVPGYYQRRNPISGAIEQSTCCDNTASEHRMMGKLVIDSLLVWAKDYKIDGFRFDLMGHQPKALMLRARDAVRQIDPDTYFYGEGWDFGEVANNAQFVQASQIELAGSEIGTFTDRLRDAVRGGRPFDEGMGIRQTQGLANGLYTLPNELQNNSQANYRLAADQARIGLTGNLADFPLHTANGERVTGKTFLYYGAPSGYAKDPADTINYVSKHDNQTLWDNNQYKIPFNVSTSDRVRMQLLALAFPLYSQGIPFIHMGSELLRSKSFLRDSYDYADWFNAVDYAMQSNHYHQGLPPAVKDKTNWALIRLLRKENRGRDKVTAGHIQQAAQAFLHMLKVRSSSPLFSLPNSQSIVQNLQFLNTGKQQVPGLLVLKITDTDHVDPNWQSVIVAFNLTAKRIHFDYPAGEYQLHPALQSGAFWAEASAQPSGFTLPQLSASVFVK